MDAGPEQEVLTPVLRRQDLLGLAICDFEVRGDRQDALHELFDVHLRQSAGCPGPTAPLGEPLVSRLSTD